MTHSAKCNPTIDDCSTYYLEHRQFVKAVSSLEEILRQSPEDLRAINLLGIALTGLGETEKANLQFTKAIQLNPGFYPALKNLALNELTMNKTAEAKAHLEETLKYAPDDEVANLYLGEIFFEAEQCGQALEHYNKARMRIVNNATYVLHFSQCLLKKNQRNQAVSFLDLIPAADADSNFEAGAILAKSGAYVEAAKHFGLARKGYRDPYAAGYNQILVYVKAGEFSNAIHTANEFFAGGCQRSELYNLVAEAYLRNNQVQEAYDALRTATRLDPKNEKNYLDLAAMCLDQNNFDLGLEITTIGLAHLPTSYRLHVQRGVLEVKRGQTAKAQEDFALAVELAPGEPLPYVALGTMLMQTGQVQKAIEILRKGSRQNPNDFLVQYMFGRALGQFGAVPGDEVEREAFAAFETSVRLNPNFWHSRAELGKLLMKRGEVERAVAELERAMALNPDGVGPAYPLAQAYRKKGDINRARELLDRVSKIQAQEREDSLKFVLEKLDREEIRPLATNQ